MVLSYSVEMDEFMPLNLEFEEFNYSNTFTDSNAMNDVKPTSEEISLLNISGNKPMVMTDISSKSDSSVDHLLKIIETQEKQNEKMMIQFRLKQVLLDYLKAKQSSTPSLCSQPNHLNISSVDSQTIYPISPVSPEGRTQFFVGDTIPPSSVSLLPINSEVISIHDRNEETSEMKLSSDSEHDNYDDNEAVVPSNRFNSNKKHNNSSKQSQKRSAHLSAEFRYRTKLNDKISKLRNIVGPKSQLSKSGVLSRSIDLINKLQKTNSKLKEENNKMRLLLMQVNNQVLNSTSNSN
jgi:hypothetical protein